MDNEGQKPEVCTYAESHLQAVCEEPEQRMALVSAELMRASGRLQAELSERSRMQNLLTKISGCFLQFATDARENINRLTTLCGEVMSADGALYNRLDRGMLIAWGQWNTPPGYNPASEPEGWICYDLIKKGVERLYICNLQESEYAETEPVARDYKFRTYLGRPVRLGEIALARCDVDVSRETVERFGVPSPPALLLFKGGELLDRISGTIAKDELFQRLKSHTQKN